MYVDRRGRRWEFVETLNDWSTPAIDHDGVQWGYLYRTPGEMKRLIEREVHRAECPGLWTCGGHPGPYVVTLRVPRGFLASGAGCWRGEWHPTFAAAIAAAHNMTGANDGRLHAV
jgi:hypothetical protein